MIERIKSSLNIKIFAITAVLLTICSIATYAFIAWLIPFTYPNQIEIDDMDIFAETLILEFSNMSYADMPYFAADVEQTARAEFGESANLHIFDKNENEVYGSGMADYDPTHKTNEYQFSLLGETETYNYFFADGGQAVNEVLLAMDSVLPYLLITVLIISLISAFFYAKYITAPIVKISKVSKQMIELDFSKILPINRTDELGTVHKNLTALAEKLSLTLGELIAANAQLAEDINKERELERQRTEFFSAVSHELKTPITIAKGQLQGMIFGVGRYKDRDNYLVKSLDTVQNLENLVGELLTIARIDRTDSTFHKNDIDISALIKASLTEKEDFFVEKDIALTCSLPKDIYYNGDRLLLKKVFDNLIVNALTYSPNGSEIFINMQNEQNILRFSIKNTGVFIPESELPKLFEAFYRPDKSRDRDTGGSGLGLYIIKQILDLHTAKYSLQSIDNTVIFTIDFI